MRICIVKSDDVYGLFMQGRLIVAGRGSWPFGQCQQSLAGAVAGISCAASPDPKDQRTSAIIINNTPRGGAFNARCYWLEEPGLLGKNINHIPS